MKKEPTTKDINKDFFNAMNYELAGDIGAIDNEDMLNNKKLITGKNKANVQNQKKKK